MNKEYNVDLGATVYDANKQLVKQTDHPLTHPELASKQLFLEEFFEDKVANYAMLLCNEQKDYTVFHLDPKNFTAPHIAAREALGCCTDRGIVYSIELTEDKQAIEIWIEIDEDMYCYYLFPYDKAVIEC